MTTGMDWIGRRIDQISAESERNGRLLERADVADYLGKFAREFERTPALNPRALIVELAQDILNGKHLKPVNVSDSNFDSNAEPSKLAE